MSKIVSLPCLCSFKISKKDSLMRLYRLLNDKNTRTQNNLINNLH